VNNDHSVRVELLPQVDQPAQRAGAMISAELLQSARPELSSPPEREVEDDFFSTLTVLMESTVPTEAIPAYRERLAPNRLELVKERGGSDATERAVQAALRWLAAH